MNAALAMRVQVARRAVAAGFSAGTWVALSSDILVFVALLVILFVYLWQRANASELSRRHVLTALTACREGVIAWGGPNLATGYVGNAAPERAHEDFTAIMHHEYGQNFCLPTEPLAALLRLPADGRFIGFGTVRAANIAMWRIGLFNQLVEQQTAFNARHATEIRGNEIDENRREDIATAAEAISLHVHGIGINDASWYTGLINSLNGNIEALNSLGPVRWWQIRQPALYEV